MKETKEETDANILSNKECGRNFACYSDCYYNGGGKGVGIFDCLLINKINQMLEKDYISYGSAVYLLVEEENKLKKIREILS